MLVQRDRKGIPAISLEGGASADQPTIVDWVLGRRLKGDEEEQQHIGPLAGVPVLGLDALSSAGYGPEAALTLLLPPRFPRAGPRRPDHGRDRGGAAHRLLLPPPDDRRVSQRGRFLHRREGENSASTPRSLAGAALALDYVLNVAVGISAGVGAPVSAAPFLLPYTRSLCLVTLALLTLVNLRGTRESGFAFMLPTYLFVGTLLAILGLGAAKAIAAGAPGGRLPAEPALADGGGRRLDRHEGVLERLHGDDRRRGGEQREVPLFRQPAVPAAQRTLTIIIAILVLLLGGVALLSRAYGIGATEPGTDGYQSVLSQLASAVVGRGGYYYVTMGSVVAVLALSANTSFADFPRLGRVLALDRYLPDTFAIRGRRLVFSYGVIVLALLAGSLLVGFGGVTDRLIPLFAVGVRSSRSRSRRRGWWSTGSGSADQARAARCGSTPSGPSRRASPWWWSSSREVR